MSEIVMGEIDWNEGDVKEGGGKTDFMKLESGTKNRIRVMGNPIQYYIHWVEVNGKKSKVNSPSSEPKLVKQLENAGFKRKASWFVKVFDRSDKKFKVLEIGPQIYSQIKGLYANEEWGPVTAYDITIERKPPGTQPLYVVTPSPKAPLDPSLKEAYTSFNDRVDLTKFIQPGDPDEVREILGWDSTEKTTTSSSSSSDDDMFNFDS